MSSDDSSESTTSPPSPISSVAESPSTSTTVMTPKKVSPKKPRLPQADLSVVSHSFRSPARTDRENSQFLKYVKEEKQIPEDRIFHVDEGFENTLRDLGVITIYDEVSDCGTKSLTGELLRRPNHLYCCMTQPD